MVKHYPDKNMDDCPIHDDKETDQFFRVELVIPIGIDKPHAGWRSSATWAQNFLVNMEPLVDKDIKKVLQYKLSIGHTGVEDDKTCFKYMEQ